MQVTRRIRWSFSILYSCQYRLVYSSVYEFAHNKGPSYPKFPSLVTSIHWATGLLRCWWRGERDDFGFLVSVPRSLVVYKLLLWGWEWGTFFFASRHREWRRSSGSLDGKGSIQWTCQGFAEKGCVPSQWQWMAKRLDILRFFFKLSYLPLSQQIRLINFKCSCFELSSYRSNMCIYLVIGETLATLL